MHVRLRAHRQAMAAARRETVVRRLGAGPPVVLVPSNRTPTRPLSARRRAAFAEWLDTLLAGAEQPPDPSAGATESRHAVRSLTDGARAAVATACGACRGWCCRGGDTRAWLTVDTIRRVQAATGATAAELRAAYLADLPRRSYAGSCVFHTARGCALHPARRSMTCHAYLCEGAEQLVTLVHGGGTSARLAAAQGVEVDRVRRWTG
jgi:hypothetical protein